MRWDDDAALKHRLSQGTRVDVLDEGVGESFNQTNKNYQWWYVRAAGIDGWVMQVLLDNVSP
jgi:hypothetical protein